MTMNPAETLKAPSAYTITDLSRQLDLTPRTLRFYENIKLITPRRDGQRRLYSENDRLRLLQIRRGVALGFTLVEIKGMLHDDATGPWLDVPKETIARQLDLMRTRLDETTAALALLQEMAAA